MAAWHGNALSATQTALGCRLWDPKAVQPAVDLGAHDLAVGRRVVEPAPQRGGQQLAGVL